MRARERVLAAVEVLLLGPRLTVDVSLPLDGVLRVAPRRGTGFGAPLGGAVDFLRQTIEAGGTVAVVADEAGKPDGVRLFREWLARYGLPSDLAARVHFVVRAPRSRVHLGDRCVRFSGAFPAAERLLSMTPWWASKVMF